MLDEDEIIKGVGERWYWLMGIIFGGIATLALRDLINTILCIASHPNGELLLILFGALSVFIFFIYDITILYFLYKKYPFHLSWFSAARLLIELIMAFLLAMIVIPVMKAPPYGSTFILLLSISIWHIFAILWHLAAEYESKKDSPPVRQIAQHILNPVIYWGLATLSILFFDSSPSIEMYNQKHTFVIVCFAIITASITRSALLIPKIKEDLLNKDRINKS